MSFKKEDKKLLFGQPKDHTVIDERLIDDALKEVGDGGTPFNEIKTLSLSYKSKTPQLCQFWPSDANCRHPDNTELRWLGQAGEITAG